MTASLYQSGSFVGVVFVLFQVLSPLHQAVSANLGNRVSAWLYDRLSESCLGPPGMGHLEDPKLTNDLTVARDFDLGMTGPPLSISMDFIAGGLVEMIGSAKAIRYRLRIQAAISARYNPQGKTPDPSLDYLLRFNEGAATREWFINSTIYFNYDALKRDGVNLEEFSQVVVSAALTVPGIARCFSRLQLLRGATSVTDPIERRVLHGFYPSRSGDVVMVAEPYKYIAESITATHGSAYSYDTHVPTIIMGRGVNPGRYLESASPADIAPTLSALLRVTAPTNSTGRVLVEGLKK